MVIIFETGIIVNDLYIINYLKDHLIYAVGGLIGVDFLYKNQITREKITACVKAT